MIPLPLRAKSIRHWQILEKAVSEVLYVRNRECCLHWDHLHAETFGFAGAKTVRASTQHQFPIREAPPAMPYRYCWLALGIPLSKLSTLTWLTHEPLWCYLLQQAHGGSYSNRACLPKRCQNQNWKIKILHWITVFAPEYWQQQLCDRRQGRRKIRPLLRKNSGPLSFYRTWAIWKRKYFP